MHNKKGRCFNLAVRSNKNIDFSLFLNWRLKQQNLICINCKTFKAVLKRWLCWKSNLHEVAIHLSWHMYIRKKHMCKWDITGRQTYAKFRSIKSMIERKLHWNCNTAVCKLHIILIQIDKQMIWSRHLMSLLTSNTCKCKNKTRTET